MANNEPETRGPCQLRADYRMSYDEVVVRTAAHCGWKTYKWVFAILGFDDSPSSFEHPVELLRACSEVLIGEPMLRLPEGPDFETLLGMAFERLS